MIETIYQSVIGIIPAAYVKYINISITCALMTARAGIGFLILYAVLNVEPFWENTRSVFGSLVQGSHHNFRGKISDDAWGLILLIVGPYLIYSTAIKAYGFYTIGNIPTSHEDIVIFIILLTSTLAALAIWSLIVISLIAWPHIHGAYQNIKQKLIPEDDH